MTKSLNLYDTIKILIDNSLLNCYIFRDIEYSDLMVRCLNAGMGLDDYVLIPIDNGILLTNMDFYSTSWNKKLDLLSPRSKCLQLAIQGLPIDCIPHINTSIKTTYLIIVDRTYRNILFVLECNVDKVDIIKRNLSKWILEVRRKVGISLFLI